MTVRPLRSHWPSKIRFDMLVLYALAMAGLLVYGLNLLWLSARLIRTERLLPGDPDAVPKDDGPFPLVTVQLPLYNEAFVAERLLDACAALDYPRRRLEIQVLDDSTDETTAIVARRTAYWRARGRDIVHIHRNDRTGYKAGALQNGLMLARGEFTAVFDADFVPSPDFLCRLMPRFDGPDVGMVQARWGHLNADRSLLTRLQAFGLDAHFALEQEARGRSGCFIHFNGTAGIWRRTCIEDAGGWQDDTLAEDLDLSYRAQLAGWRLRYVGEVEAPAELPADFNALRAQQFRWTKGAVESTRKLLWRLWRSDRPFRVRLEGTLHLTAHAVFPTILLAGLLHAPLLVMSNASSAYFAMMSVGILGMAGFVLAELLAQRGLYPDWGRRFGLFPVFMAGTMGLSLNNSIAFGEALVGRRSAFLRTPKAGGSTAADARYADHRLPRIVWLEAAIFLYTAAGVVALIGSGAWAAVPFQLVFAAGFGLVTASSLQHYHSVRRSAPHIR